MKSHLTCALAFSILFIFLLLFIPLFLIYAHLEELNIQESKLAQLEELSGLEDGLDTSGKCCVTISLGSDDQLFSSCSCFSVMFTSHLTNTSSSCFLFKLIYLLSS